MAKLRGSDQHSTESARILGTWDSSSVPDLFGWEPVAEMVRIADAEAQRLEEQLSEFVKFCGAALVACLLHSTFGLPVNPTK